LPFGTEKTRMAWLLDYEKKYLKICLFVLTEFTNVTDRLTYTGRPSLCIASRGKNIWR